LPEVMGLLVRERITGLPPPACARAAMDAWREWIEERAGADLARIETTYRDQKSFARLTRAILKDLQMADDFGEDSESAGEESGAATDICDADELIRLRNVLDQQLESMHSVVARLANKLQRLLLAQQNRSWEFDLEEGMLDSARLPRVIIDPTHPLTYKQEK